MIRFVISPEGGVVPDIASSLPGRGLWVTAQADILRKAMERRAFDRAARRKVTVPGDLMEMVEHLLARRCCETIGLARRSGQAIAGYDKVAAALKKAGGNRSNDILVEACDGAEGGRQKLASLNKTLPRLDVLTREELGRAFGREHVVHALIEGGRLATRLLLDGQRLSGFRGERDDIAENPPLSGHAGKKNVIPDQNGT